MPSPRPSLGDDRAPLRFRPWLFAGASLAVLVCVGAAGLYALRGTIGARLAVDYLARRGVPAEIEIERLDLGGFVGRVRLGPANDPDLTVDRVEASFRPIPVLTSGLAAPRLKSLLLVHPKLKASYDGERLRFGALQPLVDEALKAPPGAGPGPDVRIERGELRLATYAGPVFATGDAELTQGRLRRASGHVAAATLRPSSDVTLRLRSADVAATVHGERLDATIAAVADLDGAFKADGAALTATAALPYGRDGLARIDGAVAGDVRFTADRAAGFDTSVRDLDLYGHADGAAHGGLDGLELATSLTGSAGRFDAAGQGGAGLRLAASAGGLRWTGQGLSAQTVVVKASADRAAGFVRPAADLTLADLEATQRPAGWAAGASLAVQATAAGLDQPTPVGRLRLAALRLAARGRADLAARTPPSLVLSGALTSGRGGIEKAQAARFSAGLAGLADETRVEAALETFSLSAPAWRLAAKGGAAEVRLDQPLRLVSPDGPTLTLSPGRGPTAAIDAGGRASGAFGLALAGTGVPRLDLGVSRYGFAGGRGSAAVTLAAGLDGTLLHQATLNGAGEVGFDRDGGRFTPASCLDAQLARLGEQTPSFAENLSARLCRDGNAPFATVGSHGWQVQARIEAAAADLPIAETKVDDGAARLSLADHGGAAGGRLELTTLHAVDAAPRRRFNPLRLSGMLDLAGDQWRGPIAVSDAAKGRPLATVTVRQRASAAEGEADIAADPLVFKPKVLQPVELSPLAGLVTQVDATAHFTGKIAWRDGTVTSGGRFTTEGAAFNSFLGKVSGARADVTFDSLLPPTTAPGQSFTAETVAWIAPLTDAAARFALTPTGTEVSEARATVAHGTASLGPVSIPFADDRTIAGTLTLKGLDLGELVAGSSLADSVSIQATIDGTVPFSAGPMGVTFTDGLVASTGPGRLSIKRQALTGAVATAGAAGAQPNAIQDFAYQALENLAFDSLEARVASRPMGRLGAVFHIKGRNDPPHPTDTRIGLFDLLRGHGFDKPIDLPKGTPVDLTLDTSLNFDDLLKAYGEIGRGSGPVQP